MLEGTVRQYRTVHTDDGNLFGLDTLMRISIKYHLLLRRVGCGEQARCCESCEDVFHVDDDGGEMRGDGQYIVN